MTLKNYQIASKRTMASLGSLELDLCHCMLGVHSEFSEICEGIEKQDNVNIGEEVIDVFFYLANYCTFRNLNLEDYYHPVDSKDITTNTILLSIAQTTSNLQDIVKKFIAYKKPINLAQELVCIEDLLYDLSLLIDKYDLNLENILQNNVDKLLVRFPLSFSETLANNRDLESERKQLEK